MCRGSRVEDPIDGVSVKSLKRFADDSGSLMNRVVGEVHRDRQALRRRLSQALLIWRQRKAEEAWFSVYDVEVVFVTEAYRPYDRSIL